MVIVETYDEIEALERGLKRLNQVMGEDFPDGRPEMSEEAEG